MDLHGNRPTSLLPLAVVEQRTGYRKSTIYDLLKVGGFPRPVRDGRTIRFVEREVDQWVADRIAGRDATLGRDKPVLLTETQKAAELGCSVSYLQKDRAKTCPAVPFVRVGPHVRYAPGIAQGATA